MDASNARGASQVAGTRAWRQRSLILAALALLAVGCQDDDSEPSGLPTPVAETRSHILSAAETGDYDRLPSLLNDENLASPTERGGSSCSKAVPRAQRVPARPREARVRRRGLLRVARRAPTA